VYTGERHLDYGVYDRYRIPPGKTIDGPAIVEEDESTTIVTENYSLSVGEEGGLHATRQ
jgi:N-methylhydantoinase A/oxoprolinase/acetone carboxylase beta subunit